MNCDPIARCYWLLEHLVFGRALERRRGEFLEEVANARTVLILGDGDGRFAAEFVNRNPTARVDSVDLSAKMLSLARRRMRGQNPDNERVRFLQGDARTIDLTKEYDLIVTHFFLDCFTPLELRSLLARISAYACTDAQWLVSEFHLPRAGLSRVAARVLLRAMFLFFRLATGLEANQLPEYPPALASHGFQLLRRRSTASGLLVSELWQRGRPSHRRPLSAEAVTFS